MISRALLLILCSMIASCGRERQTESGPEVEAGECRANASRAISGPDMPRYVATAYAIGPDCKHAAILLVVRLGADVRHIDAVNARDGLMSNVESEEELEQFLRTWLSPDFVPTSSGELPAWEENSEETTQQTTDVNGNFFTPAIGRQWYGRIRAMDAPLFCYARVQGNLTCYAFVNSGLELVGVYEHED